MATDARPIRIVTDSGADLPAETVESLDITVVPMLISFGQETFADQELGAEDFWRRARGAHPPKTSQPPTGAFLQAFERLVAQGHDVVCITFTGAHSGAFNSAWSASNRFDGRVTVVDSRSLSLAQGWQVIRAAELALQGAGRATILSAIESLRARTRVYIQLDSLESIRRGGRAALLMPTIDRMIRALNIKPILNIAEGQLRLLGAARSTAKGLVRIAAELAALGPLEMAQVMHIRAEQGALHLVREITATTHLALERIGIGEAGQVLACHGGEGVVGVGGLLAP